MEQFIAFERGYWQKSTSIGFIFSLGTIMGFIVGVVIVYQILYTDVSDHIAEYATLKALGFGPGFVAFLILGESVALTLLGGALGILLTFPVVSTFKTTIGAIFPSFRVSQETLVWQAASVVAVALLAAIVPAIRSARIKIVDGLRHVA